MSCVEGAVVLTGAAGFLGRRLMPRLAGMGRTMLAVDRVSPSSGIPKGIQFHQSDLSDPTDLVPAGFDVSSGFTLVHLAWDMRRGRAFADQAKQVHLLAGLLDHWGGRGLERVIGMGSAEEYGRRGGLIAEYEPPIEPLSPYGWAKRAAHDLAVSWAGRERKNLMWMRPFIIYGAGQGGDMMLPYALAQARARKPAQFTDGMQERDFIHVDDVVEAIKRVLERRPPGIHDVNLGTGMPVKVRDVLMEIAHRMHADDLFELGARERRSGEPDRQVADIRLARELLEWRPTVEWREGIRGMCEDVEGFQARNEDNGRM